ncbi:hypothetical protein Agub_g13681 [Astrephomene gubernaculifera]|uniref:SGNH hydrolase-type esterase domain-containing protein n=1 Tax=Astrephomene gubernaculifera TaxID=47775 RepID=A0AAD3E4I8_9CHLO|nr:hypothetical protein Agub_g13681 [Astrephomene gubernaculifera]
MLPRRVFLAALFTLVVLPSIVLGYKHATQPRTDNLTALEVQYAHIYWKYKVSSRVVRPKGIPKKPQPGRPDLGYAFLTPLPERLAGITYTGHAARLRLVLERARNGEALRVAALGGSITFGQSAGGAHMSYAAMFVDWLNAALPPSRPSDHHHMSQPLEAHADGDADDRDNSTAVSSDTSDSSTQQLVRRRRRMHESASTSTAPPVPAAATGPHSPSPSTSTPAAAVPHHHDPVRHLYFNGAVPGTQSGYMSSCMHHHLPPEVDVVLVEYAVNDSPAPSAMFWDPSRRAFERLLRKLQRLPSQPAVLLVNMFAYTAAHGKYWHSAERDFNELATYYGLPSVSLRAAVLPSALSSSSSSSDTSATPAGGSSASDGSVTDAAGGPSSNSSGSSSTSSSSTTSNSSSGGGGGGGVLLGAVFNGGKHHPGRGGHVVATELLISLALELLHSNSRITADGAADGSLGLSLAPSGDSSSQPSDRTFPNAAGGKSSSSSRGRRRISSSSATGSTTAMPAPADSDTAASIYLDSSVAALGAGKSKSRSKRRSTREKAKAATVPGLTPEAAAGLRAVATRPLPPPLSEGNYEAASSTCYLEHQLRELVEQPVTGWEWTDEGRGKWGWVAMEANQQLRIKVSTQLAGSRTPRAEAASIIVQIAYLQSYVGMGGARLSCEAGCACEALVVDGHSSRQVSVTSMADVKVTQHPNCMLLLNTTGPTKAARTAAAAAAKAAATAAKDDGRSAAGSSSSNSGPGAKFKLLGVVVGEEPGATSGTVTWLRNESHEMAHVIRDMESSDRRESTP